MGSGTEGGRPFLGGWVLGPSAEGAENFFLLLPIEWWLKKIFLGGWVGGLEPPPPPPLGVGHFWVGGSAGNSGWVGLPINPPPPSRG